MKAWRLNEDHHFFSPDPSEKTDISTREELGSKSLIMDWQSHRNRKWIRTVALILVVTFVHQDLVWAQGGTPIWSKGSNGSFSVKPSATPESTITVPKDVAVTKEAYTGKDGKTIINIQDAHASLTAQESISSILDSLVTNYDLKLVAIEGSSGYIDTSLLRTFPDENIRKETAGYLMARGRMSAGEFFSITSDRNIALYGIEDRPLYQENVDQFRQVYEINRSLEGDLSGLDRALKGLKDKIYTDEMKELDANSVLHRDGKLAFSKRWELVGNIAAKVNLDYRKYDNLTKLVESLKLEKEIDFQKANKERDALIDVLSKALPKQELEELVLKSLSFKMNKISKGEYYVFLQGLADKNYISPDPYRNLIIYTDYITLYESIDLFAIFDEVQAFEDAIKERLFTNDYQRRLHRISRCVSFTKDLFELKLVGADLEYLADNIATCNAGYIAGFIRDASLRYGVAIEGNYDLSKIFDSIPRALDFYRTADMRNSSMLANTIKRMDSEGASVAALITGGYHSKGLGELLRQKNTSYLVILPKFDASKGERPYVAILTNKREPYEGLLKGGQYYLATGAYFEGVKQVTSKEEITALGARLADAVIYPLKRIIVERAGEMPDAEFSRLVKTKPGREKVKSVLETWISAYEGRYTKGGWPRDAAPMTPKAFRELLYNVVFDATGTDILATQEEADRLRAIEERLKAVESKIYERSEEGQTEKAAERFISGVAGNADRIRAIYEENFEHYPQRAINRENVESFLEIMLRRKGINVRMEDYRSNRVISGLIDRITEAVRPLRPLQPAPAPLTSPAPSEIEAEAAQALEERRKIVAEEGVLTAEEVALRDELYSYKERVAERLIRHTVDHVPPATTAAETDKWHGRLPQNRREWLEYLLDKGHRSVIFHIFGVSGIEELDALDTSLMGKNLIDRTEAIFTAYEEGLPVIREARGKVREVETRYSDDQRLMSLAGMVDEYDMAYTADDLRAMREGAEELLQTIAERDRKPAGPPAQVPSASAAPSPERPGARPYDEGRALVEAVLVASAAGLIISLPGPITLVINALFAAAGIPPILSGTRLELAGIAAVIFVIFKAIFKTWQAAKRLAVSRNIATLTHVKRFLQINDTEFANDPDVVKMIFEIGIDTLQKRAGERAHRTGGASLEETSDGDAEDLIIIQDIHGNLRNLRSILIAENIIEGLRQGRIQLEIRGDIIHPVSPLISSEERQVSIPSLAALLLIVELQVRYPGRVHINIGNHENAHVSREAIHKDGSEKVSELEDAIEKGFGPADADLITGKMADYIELLPVITTQEAGDNIKIAGFHAVPDGARIPEEYDFGDMFRAGRMIGSRAGGSRNIPLSTFLIGDNIESSLPDMGALLDRMGGEGEIVIGTCGHLTTRDLKSIKGKGFTTIGDEDGGDPAFVLAGDRLVAGVSYNRPAYLKIGLRHPFGQGGKPDVANLVDSEGGSAFKIAREVTVHHISIPPHGVKSFFTALLVTLGMVLANPASGNVSTIAPIGSMTQAGMGEAGRPVAEDVEALEKRMLEEALEPLTIEKMPAEAPIAGRPEISYRLDPVSEGMSVTENHYAFGEHIFTNQIMSGQCVGVVVMTDKGAFLAHLTPPHLDKENIRAEEAGQPARDATHDKVLQIAGELVRHGVTDHKDVKVYVFHSGGDLMVDGVVQHNFATEAKESLRKVFGKVVAVPFIHEMGITLVIDRAVKDDGRKGYEVKVIGSDNVFAVRKGFYDSGTGELKMADPDFGDTLDTLKPLGIVLALSIILLGIGSAIVYAFKASARYLYERKGPGVIRRTASDLAETVLIGIASVLGWVIGKAWKYTGLFIDSVLRRQAVSRGREDDDRSRKYKSIWSAGLAAAMTSAAALLTGDAFHHIPEITLGIMAAIFALQAAGFIYSYLNPAKDLDPSIRDKATPFTSFTEGASTKDGSIRVNSRLPYIFQRWFYSHEVMHNRLERYGIKNAFLSEFLMLFIFDMPLLLATLLRSGAGPAIYPPETIADVKRIESVYARAMPYAHQDYQTAAAMHLAGEGNNNAEIKCGGGKTKVGVIATALELLRIKRSGSTDAIIRTTTHDSLSEKDAEEGAIVYSILGQELFGTPFTASLIIKGKDGRDEAYEFVVKDGRAAKVRVDIDDAFTRDVVYLLVDKGIHRTEAESLLDDKEAFMARSWHWLADEGDVAFYFDASNTYLISGGARADAATRNVFRVSVEEAVKALYDVTRDGKTHKPVSKNCIVDDSQRTISFNRWAREEFLKRLGDVLGEEEVRASRELLLRFSEEALQAHLYYEAGKNYEVRGGEVVLVSEDEGSLQPGRELSGGLQNAIRAKEGVALKDETLPQAQMPLHVYLGLNNIHGGQLIKKFGIMTGTMPRGIDEIYGTSTRTFQPDIELEKKDHRPVMSSTKEKKRALYSKEIQKELESAQAVIVHCASENDEAESIMALAAAYGWAKTGATPRETVDNARSYLRDNKRINIEGVTIRSTEGGDLDKIRQIVKERAGRPRTVTFITNLGSRGLDYQITQAVNETAGEARISFTGISTFFSPYMALYQQFGGRIGRPVWVEDEKGGHLEPTPGTLKAFWSLEDETFVQYEHFERMALNALARKVKAIEERGGVAEMDDPGLDIRDTTDPGTGRVIIRRRTLSNLAKKIEDNLIETFQQQKKVDALLFSETAITLRDGTTLRESIWNAYTNMLRRLKRGGFISALFDTESELGASLSRALREKADAISAHIAQYGTRNEKIAELIKSFDEGISEDRKGFGLKVSYDIAGELADAGDVSFAVQKFIKDFVARSTLETLSQRWGGYLLEMEDYRNKLRRSAWAQQASQVNALLGQAKVAREQFKGVLAATEKEAADICIGMILYGKSEIAKEVAREGLPLIRAPDIAATVSGFAWKSVLISAVTYITYQLSVAVFSFFSFLPKMSGQAGGEGLANIAGIFDHIPGTISALPPEISILLAGVMSLLLVALLPIIRKIQAKDISGQEIELAKEEYAIKGSAVTVGIRYLLNSKVMSAVNMLAPMASLLLIFSHVVSAGGASPAMAVLSTVLPGVASPLLTLALVSAVIGLVSYALTIMINFSNIKRPHATESKPAKEGFGAFIHGLATIIVSAGIYTTLGMSALGIGAMAAVAVITAGYFTYAVKVGKREAEAPHVVGYVSAGAAFYLLSQYLAPLYAAHPIFIAVTGILGGLIMAVGGIKQIAGQAKLLKDSFRPLTGGAHRKTFLDKASVISDYLFKSNIFTLNGVIIAVLAGAAAIGAFYGLLPVVDTTNVAYYQYAALLVAAMVIVLARVMSSSNALSRAVERGFRPKNVVRATGFLMTASIATGNVSASAAVASQVQGTAAMKERAGAAQPAGLREAVETGVAKALHGVPAPAEKAAPAPERTALRTQKSSGNFQIVREVGPGGDIIHTYVRKFVNNTWITDIQMDPDGTVTLYEYDGITFAGAVKYYTNGDKEELNDRWQVTEKTASATDFKKGANLPWQNYGRDIGSTVPGMGFSSGDNEEFLIDSLRPFAGQTVRLNLFTDLRDCIDFSDPDSLRFYNADKVFADMDTLLEAAGICGVKLDIVLFDYWIAYGPGSGDTGHPEAIKDPGLRGQVVALMSSVISRYADDPQINSYEVMNEQYYGTDASPWGNQHPTDPVMSTVTVGEMATFLTDFIYMIRINDPGKPIMICFANRNDVTSGNWTAFIDGSGDDDADMIDYHYWAKDNYYSFDNLSGPASDPIFMGKPVTIGEIDPQYYNVGLDPDFTGRLDAVYGGGNAAGYFWQGDGFTTPITPEDLARFQDWYRGVRYTYYLPSGNVMTATYSDGNVYEYQDNDYDRSDHFGRMYLHTLPSGIYFRQSEFIANHDSILRQDKYFADGTFGGHSIFTYYSNGPVETRTNYNADGSLVDSYRIIEYYSDGSIKRQEKYNAAGVKVATYLIDEYYAETFGQEKLVFRQTEYDGAGRFVFSSDLYYYTGTNLVEREDLYSQSGAYQGRFAYEYFQGTDTISRKTRYDAAGNPVAVYTYDRLSRLIRETNADGSYKEFEYYGTTSARHYVREYDEGGILRITYEYDTSDRLITERHTDGSYKEFEYYTGTPIRSVMREYDTNGLLAATYTYENTIANRLLTELRVTANSNGEIYFVYTYDQAGNVTKKAYSDQAGTDLVATYTYKAADPERVATILLAEANSDGEIYFVYTYDDVNHTITKKAYKDASGTILRATYYY
ncbi:MAG: hypothetical protein WC515_08825, partial [Candidatus Omnitrophota bacterium]